jgi:hypothetical protein
MSSRPLSRFAQAAFEHPTWWVALVVLVANDHLLKGAGVLPSVLTGKLSDFAGLYVVPGVLAALLRVRSRAAWASCHVVVGVCFAAINVWPRASIAFEELFGVVNVCDPTDLLALPMLAVSIWAFTPSGQSAPPRAVRNVDRVRAFVGALACVATAAPKTPPCPPDTVGVSCLRAYRAPMFVHNTASKDVKVSIRVLRGNAEVSCIAAAANPCVLRDEHFAEAKIVTLMPRQTAAITPNVCAVAWISPDPWLAPVILVRGDGTDPKSEVLVPYFASVDEVPFGSGALVDVDGHTVLGAVRPYLCPETSP